MQTSIKAYGCEPLQQVLIGETGSPSDPDSPWVIYIHGGAWRDPRNSFNDSNQLFERLMDKGVITHAASINYRLSPYVQHPAHLDDIIAALTMLMETCEISSYVLVGHSAGAFLALQALILTSVEQRKLIFSKCSTIICAEGLYDLGTLVQEYPSYLDFVKPAFGTNETDWAKASPASGLYEIPSSELGADLPGSSGAIVIVHSDEDELVSWRQPNIAKTAFGKSPGAIVETEKVNGEHNSVPSSEGLCDVVEKCIKKIPKNSNLS